MVDTLCAQLLIQFYTDRFETLHTLLSWSVDVHMVLALLSVKLLSIFFTFKLSHFCSVNACLREGI